jgi:hypothetical protein
MRKIALVVTVAAISGVALSVFRWGPSMAQFSGGGSVEVFVLNEIVARLAEPVALDQASLDALNEPQCPPLSMGHMGVDGTVRLVPLSADGSRTRLIVVNHANTGYLSCRTGPSVGFTSPVCTIAAAGAAQEGARLDSGASMTLDITSTDLLRCINCANDGNVSGNTAQVSYIELSCL